MREKAMAPLDQYVRATVVEPLLDGRKDMAREAVLSLSLRRVDARELVKAPVQTLGVRL
jgi:hypothetical protein